MKKPLTGWPKYCPPNQLHYGKLATVFIIWGIVSLVTALYFNNIVEKKTFNFTPPYLSLNDIVGPINTKKHGEVYQLSIIAKMPVQSWSFVEGEVLNADKEYLYSFGKELWHETGRDSDGWWKENKNNYNIKITFPHVGTYFLRIKTESNKKPSNIVVKVTKKRGSALPHFWFGIFIILIGLILNEISNRTIVKILGM